MSSTQSVPMLSAKTIATYFLTPPSQAHIEIGQAEHRIKLISLWSIPQGSRILEIGCGQGNCTAVLAEAVGPTGHIDAVDPGSPDYGAPFTLAEAQAHLSSSPVGDRITWHNNDPIEFLTKQSNVSWDFVIFTHCIWYFESQDTLFNMLMQLRTRAKRLLIAEYALAATERSAAPHVLAAIARATLEAHTETSDSNIRCLIGPRDIKTTAARARWTFEHEDTIVPAQTLLDGHWEVSAVKDEAFLKEIEMHVKDQGMKTLLRSSRDAVTNSLELSAVDKATTMDVWAGSFT